MTSPGPLASLRTYLGLDVSPSAIARCVQSFGADPTESFAAYLTDLFASAERFVVICARDAELPGGPDEKYRAFTPWVAAHTPEWELVERASPPADVDLVSDLFLFARRR